jgi:glutathione S-transferase
MLKLYGFAASNYFNIVKLALLEKGVPFETVPFHGCQNPDILAVSPRGKVPVLETEQGFLSETDAILNYIEETQAGIALLPADPFARASVRAMAKEIELYIELPARVCYVEVFFGGRPTPEALKAKAERDLIKGFTALKHRARFARLTWRGSSLRWLTCIFCTVSTWLWTLENACSALTSCPVYLAHRRYWNVWQTIPMCEKSPLTGEPRRRFFWHGCVRWVIRVAEMREPDGDDHRALVLLCISGWRATPGHERLPASPAPGQYRRCGCGR